MSKASRNNRRRINALRPVHEERVDDFGLNPDPRFDQIIDDTVMQSRHILVKSTAVHSKTLGWIPGMMITYDLVPLQGDGPGQTVKIMLLGEELMLDHVQTLNVGLDHAVLDAAKGYRQT